MNDLSIRFLTAVVFLTIMITGLFYSIYSMMLLFLGVNILAIWEYQTLLDTHPARQHQSPFEEKIIMCLVSSIVYMVIAGTSLNFLAINNIAWLLPLISMLFIKELYAGNKNPFIHLSLNLTAILYITVPCALVNIIANYDGNFEPLRILGILFLVWVNDTGAYFTGRKFGKTKLFERVSPKKTWEGSVGGAVTVFIVAYLLILIFPPVFSATQWLGIALISIVFGTLGDLIESLLKRTLKVKDSGTILPGHGGILDRFDALIFALPFIYAFLCLWNG